MVGSITLDLDNAMSPTTPPNVREVLNISSATLDLLFSVRELLESKASEGGSANTPKPAFSPEQTHDDLVLSCANHAVTKAGGLYRSARCSVPLPLNKPCYFEIEYTKCIEGSGVCLGLSTNSVKLNKLVGTQPHSVGFYSLGNIVRGGVFTDYGESWSRDEAVIGCLAVLTEGVNDKGNECYLCDLQFSVNGIRYEAVEPPFEFPAKTDVFPTVSLYAKDSSILSRFEARDLVHTEGLPPDTVSLDGLVIAELSQED